jgi:hypothetical protein
MLFFSNTLAGTSGCIWIVAKVLFKLFSSYGKVRQLFSSMKNPFSFLHVSCIVVVVVVLLLKTPGKPMIIFLSKSFLWSDCKWEYVYGGFLGASQPYIMGALLLCKLFVPFILVTYMTRPKHSCYDSLLTKTAEVVTYPNKNPFNISSIEEH